MSLFLSYTLTLSLSFLKARSSLYGSLFPLMSSVGLNMYLQVCSFSHVPNLMVNFIFSLSFLSHTLTHSLSPYLFFLFFLCCFFMLIYKYTYMYIYTFDRCSNNKYRNFKVSYSLNVGKFTWRRLFILYLIKLYHSRSLSF